MTNATCIACGTTIHNFDNAGNVGPFAHWAWITGDICVGPCCARCIVNAAAEARRKYIRALRRTPSKGDHHVH